MNNSDTDVAPCKVDNQRVICSKMYQGEDDSVERRWLLEQVVVVVGLPLDVSRDSCVHLLPGHVRIDVYFAVVESWNPRGIHLSTWASMSYILKTAWYEWMCSPMPP